MRVALYVRRSTDEKRQADSINAQLALLRAFSDREGHEIVDESFRDNASGRTAQRYGFQRLIEAVQGGPSFEAVLVRDVTRWGRFENIDESAFWEFYFLSHGVRVIYIEETFREERGPSSSILKMLRRYAAAEFSREKSRLVQFGHYRTVQAGFRLGGDPPFGMVRILTNGDGSPIQVLKRGDRKLLNGTRVKLSAGSPAAVEIVRSMFQWFGRDGLSVREIVTRLNDQGVKSAKGSRWDDTVVRYILRNPAYAGAARSRLNRSENFDKNQEIVTAGAWPAIIDPELWRAVQDRFEARRQRSSPAGLARQLRQMLEEMGHVDTTLFGTSGRSTFETYRLYFERGDSDAILDAYVPEVNAAKEGAIAELSKHFRLERDGDRLSLNDLVTVAFKVAFPRGHQLGGLQWRFTFDPEERQDVTIAIAFSPTTAVACYFLVANVQFKKPKRVFAPRMFSDETRRTQRTLDQVIRALQRDLLRYSSVARSKFFDAIKDSPLVNTQEVARSLGWKEESGLLIYRSLQRNGWPVPPLRYERGRRITLVCDDCGASRSLAPASAMEHKTSLCFDCSQLRRVKFATCPDCGKTRQCRRGDFAHLMSGSNSRCRSCQARVNGRRLLHEMPRDPVTGRFVRPT